MLRRRNECAFRMQRSDARALVIGSLAVVDRLDGDAIAALCVDGSHALGALSEQELTQATSVRDADEPWVRSNYPQWLHDELSLTFGGALSREMRALNERAPLDLRANALKATREQVLLELREAGVEAAAIPATRHGLRVAVGTDAKVTALDGYAQGRFEIQDEASQQSVALAGARAGETMVDLAAGGGGKALALAAEMTNAGRVLVCDIEASRLKKAEARIARAGATIIETQGDPYGLAVKAAVGPGADAVFVDAPCSGSGTWRRNPEAKWTLDEQRLEGYRAAQVQLLDRAVELVHPGGRIVYAVCSVLPSERQAQIDAFIGRHDGWRVDGSLDLTPARDATDGFFAARLVRSGGLP